MNFNKYDIQKPSELPLQDWKESDAVILLSEYLKIKSDSGIKLYQNDGAPCLIFNPALQSKEKNPGRWEIAKVAAGLLLDASDDLRELVSSGKLSLPVVTAEKIKRERVLPGG